MVGNVDTILNMPVCESRTINANFILTNNRKMRDRSAGLDMQTAEQGSYV